MLTRRGRRYLDIAAMVAFAIGAAIAYGRDTAVAIFLGLFALISGGQALWDHKSRRRPAAPVVLVCPLLIAFAWYRYRYLHTIDYAEVWGNVVVGVIFGAISLWPRSWPD
jgi:hypothetical protein